MILIGIKFKSQEINKMYNYFSYVNEDMKLKNDTFEKFYMEINKKEDKNLGNFRWHNYCIKVKGSIGWNRDYKSSNVLEIYSLIILELSRTCNDLEKLIDLIIIQKMVLEFCCYRKNIVFDEIETYKITEEKLRMNVGNFYIIHEKNTKESNRKNIEKLIDVNDIDENFAKIYTMINKNQIYIEHFCKNVEDIRVYDTARILSILIAFENTYEKIYGNGNVFSEEYEFVKKDVIEYIDKKIMSNKGKLKKKYKKMKNSIQKYNEGYEESLKYALTDNYEILKFFINRIYDVKNSKKVIESCSKRIAIIRNSMAHGSLNIKFNPINSNDIHLVEILVYAIILKYIGLKDEVVIEKLKKVFNFR